MSVALVIKPQYGPGARREWTVQTPGAGAQRSATTGLPKAFVAYARTWTAAQTAIREIEASLRRLDSKLEDCPPDIITQEFIDSRPRGQRPMGAIRQLIWKAAQHN